MTNPKSSQSIKTWSEEDRPREKLLVKGVSALTNAELLAILIGSGTREISAVELSRIILNSVENDLNALGKRSVKELMRHKGIGEAKAISIVAAMEISRRRLLKGKDDMVVITSSKNAYDTIGPQLMDLQHEEFWVLLLNKGMRLIKRVHIGIGGIGGVVADKTIIFKHAIDHLASSMILIHNHPSGRLKPSVQDDKITRELVEGGKILGINVADHLIIGGSSYYSYLDEGRI